MVKIKKSGFILFLLDLIIFINVGGGMFLGNGIPFLNTYVGIRWTTAIIAVVLFVWCIFTRMISWIEKSSRSYFCCLIVTLVIFVLIHSIYSIRTYNQSIGQTFITILDFSYLLLIYPIMYVWSKDKLNFYHLLKSIVFWTTVSLLLRTITCLVYDATSKVILPALLDFKGIRIRNERLKLDNTCFGNIAYIISYYLALHRNGIKKYIYLLVSVGMTLYSFLIYQRRGFFILQISVLIIMQIIKYKGTGRKLFASLGIVFISIVVLSQGYLTAYFNTFSTNNEDYGLSTKIRIMELDYYMDLLDKHLLLGISAGSTENSKALSLMRGDSKYLFWFEDLGILGGIFHYGLSVLVLYLMIFWREIKITLRIAMKTRDLDYDQFFLSAVLLLNVLIGAFTYDIFLKEYILCVPFQIAIYEQMIIMVGADKKESFNEDIYSNIPQVI